MEDNNGTDEDTTVRVAVRCRPFNSKEKANGETSCVRISSDQVVLVNPSNNEEHSFAFDLVIDENWTQESVWVNVGIPILNKAFNGYNGTIFAYGQTGSGKTWSMQGAEGDDLQGIIPRMNSQLFERVGSEMKKRPTVQFLITVSYFEIYNEVIFDLLDSSDRKKRTAAAKGGLEIKEHPVLGVYVKGLQEIVVDNAPKLQSIIDQGMRNRTVASTQMNADSSRSHSVFIINLHQKDVEDESKNVFAKVNLVDLAGSERVKSTGATGSILKEGANINKSLSALGNVINALVEASKGKGAFIPYRNSKLTRVLQESLGGNSITAMLAALSPAACNFEETLSTLKYANRAKAIKVKAVKNEQSSQVSKLNEEIKALKDKLMNQGSQADSSVLDEKNRQRLKDLEDAMRSTWEAKSKMSEEHERDRQQLLIEQQNAARQFEAARLRNWALLEQKGDLDITLSHVRALVTDRLAQSSVSHLLHQWTDALREVSVLERKLVEQDTVVQVYRNSLGKDSHSLLQQQQSARKHGSGGSASFDSTSFSMLRQLREKFSVIHREMQKWTALQDELLSKIQQVTQQIREAGTARSILAKTAASLASTEPATDTARSEREGLSKDERRELSKGVSLIRKQVQQKYLRTRETVAVSRRDFVDFHSIRSDLTALLSLFDDSVKAIHSEFKANDTDDAAVAEITGTLRDQAKSIAAQVSQCTTSLAGLFDMLEQALRVSQEMSRMASTSSLRVDSGMPPGAASKSPAVEEVPVENVSIEGFDPSLIHNPRAGTTVTSNPAASVIGVDSASSWCVPLSRMSDRGVPPPLVLSLPTAQIVSSLQLQGGQVVGDIAPGVGSSDSLSSLAPTSAASSAGAGPTSIANVTLPCGVSLASIEPKYELTAIALADVFDWTDLIKSNQPEKFLKRPPVRFLFDLIRFVGTNNQGFLDEALADADWAVVGADKASKLDFMEKTIGFVTKAVGAAEPVTSASAIVTGSDPELTNVLLQQLAVALYAFQNKIQTGPETSLPATADPKASARPPVAKPAAQDAWVTQIKVETSEDGRTWSVLGEYNTGLLAAQQVVSIPLLPGAKLTSTGGRMSKTPSLAALPDVRAKFLRITPLKWSGEGKHGPAMRVNLLGPEVYSDAEDPAAEVGGGVVPLRTEAVVEAVKVLLGTLATLIEAAEFLSRKEEAQKELKQLEVKKSMENLAKDKQALEALLANEKKSLENDNQDLSEKLANCLHQLKETQGLFHKEQEINTQLESNRSQLEVDKAALQRSLAEKEEENAQLRATILALQASSERERNQSETIQVKLTESEALAETLQEQLQQAEEARQAAEQEREDLHGQIMILTEERDTARVQEEELFEKLTERTFDLDRLRESYVEITDRWNDAQDEVMDLRDKIESLQSALESKSFLQSTAASIAHNQAHMNSLYAASPLTSVSADAVPKAYHAEPSSSEPQVSPRGSKMTQPSSSVATSAAGAKALTPSKPETRGAKVSPRGANSHQYVTPSATASLPPHVAEEKPAVSSTGGGTGSSGAAGQSKVSGSSPRKPPPAPVASYSSEYGDEAFDDYEEEFEPED